jgi:hypothetical protein
MTTIERTTQRTTPPGAILAGVVIAAVVAACGSTGSSASPASQIPSPNGGASNAGSASTVPTSATTSTPSASVAANPALYDEGATYAPAIDPADFSTTVENPWWPLPRGTTWVFEGESDGSPERNEVTVTQDTKQVIGVATVVVHDQVFVDDALAEDTFDWYAQDRAGNVWYFGEATAEYEDGKVTSTEGSWEAGVDGAQPGIVMPAQPVLGETYRQEFFRGHAEDLAKAIDLAATVKVPYGSWSDALQTEEWSPLDPGIVEHKAYVKGIGFVREDRVKGEGTETVTLVEMRPSG